MPKILLVEDNAMNRDMLSKRLERKGYCVLSAHDGEQGHFLACSEAPDLNGFNHASAYDETALQTTPVFRISLKSRLARPPGRS